jgi:hypothetical protein
MPFYGEVRSMPVAFAASTVPFLTVWNVVSAPVLMSLPRLLKKLPMSPELLLVPAAMIAKHSSNFADVHLMA